MKTLLIAVVLAMSAVSAQACGTMCAGGPIAGYSGPAFVADWSMAVSTPVPSGKALQSLQTAAEVGGAMVFDGNTRPASDSFVSASAAQPASPVTATPTTTPPVRMNADYVPLPVHENWQPQTEDTTDKKILIGAGIGAGVGGLALGAVSSSFLLGALVGGVIGGILGLAIAAAIYTVKE